MVNKVVRIRGLTQTLVRPESGCSRHTVASAVVNLLAASSQKYSTYLRNCFISTYVRYNQENKDFFFFTRGDRRMWSRPRCARRNPHGVKKKEPFLVDDEGQVSDVGLAGGGHEGSHVEQHEHVCLRAGKAPKVRYKVRERGQAGFVTHWPKKNIT